MISFRQKYAENNLPAFLIRPLSSRQVKYLKFCAGNGAVFQDKDNYITLKRWENGKTAWRTAAFEKSV